MVTGEAVPGFLVAKEDLLNGMTVFLGTAHELVAEKA